MVKRKRASVQHDADVSLYSTTAPPTANSISPTSMATSISPTSMTTPISPTSIIIPTSTPITDRPIAQPHPIMQSPSIAATPSSSSALQAELAKVAICPVCLSSFEERVYLSPCFHSYCAACLDAWVAVSVSCPMCKTRPDKLHYGVDTTRRVLHTLHITRPTTTAPSWKDKLHQLALQGQPGDETLWGSSLNHADVHAIEEDDDDQDMIQQDSLTTSASTSQRSRSPTPIDSTSTFDYDAQPFFLSSKSPTVDPVSSSSSFSYSFPSLADPNTGLVTPAAAGTAISTPLRIDVYRHHLVPTPAANYPKAAQIHAHDLPLLRPFLKRDLAVLTESSPSVLVQSLVESLLCSVIPATTTRRPRLPPPPVSGLSTKQESQTSAVRGAVTTIEDSFSDDLERSWALVADQIAEWITLSTHSEAPRPAQALARQFVDEMRQVAQRHLAVRPWDAQVLYAPLSF